MRLRPHPVLFHIAAGGVITLGATCWVAPASTADTPAAPTSPRIENTTCAFPEILTRYDAPVAFPGLRFERPLFVGTAPGDPDTMFVAEQSGRIAAFDRRENVATTTTFLALGRANGLLESGSGGGNEEGLLGVAFHPDYAANGRFFVYYSSRMGCPSGARRCTRLSEFRRQRARRADASSERPLLAIAQPFSNHNGGDLHFGQDGLLYISVGDGGSAGDPRDHGQNPNTLLGSILRIDVDTPGASPYGIPPDNPFARGGGRPEVYTWGVRNMWRMGFDRATGVLWGGDVGQDAREEIDKIDRPGLNLGWNCREGSRPFRGCGGDFREPVYDYPHREGVSVTGGRVYRGPDLAELFGAYIFADFASGQVWALRERGAGVAVERLVANAGNVSSFGEDAESRLYLTTFDGRVRRLAATDASPIAVPQQLSATGCFSDPAGQVMAPGVVPYEVNQPFWSDGLRKERFLALPAGQTASAQPDGRFTFPTGTVFIKTFYTPLGGGAARGGAARGGAERALETRFYTRQPRGWVGLSYRWNDDGRDATLVDGARTEVIDTQDGPLTWLYPSGAQCNRCHTEAAGRVLGFTAAQLDRLVSDGQRMVDQLDALVGAGYLDGTFRPGPLPALDHPAAPLADRARAWLDVNCAMCHRPAGPTPANLDLRFDVAFVDTGLCGRAPVGDALGLPDPRLIRPGNPTDSLLTARIRRRNTGQMPPLATTRVDSAGTDAVSMWIASLTSCPAR